MNFWFETLGLISPGFILSAFIRLLLATLFGGIIGYERENNRHPAGLRTHVLVCLGACLVMVLAEFMLIQYGGTDPVRMGAQVISGIGFLGAGTIIKEGFSVRGLTTAATLWAVSCVGLATGAGFYFGALFATILIYITLKVVKKIVMEHYKRIMVSIVCGEEAPPVESCVGIMESGGFLIESTAVCENRVSGKYELRLYGECKRKNADIAVALSEIRLQKGVSSATLGHADH